MGVMIFDDSCWPVTIIVLKGTQSLEDHQRMMACWTDWFDRETPFVPLRIHLDSEAIAVGPGIAKATKTWLQHGAGDAIRERVKAMPIVVAPDSYEATKHMSVEAVFGVPGGIFPGLREAVDWLMENTALSPEQARGIFNCAEKLVSDAV